MYLTNPSIRAALFAPSSAADQAMGDLAETGIWSQWFHADQDLHYARWKDGEVDIVCLDPQTLKPDWVVEVKWSDRYAEDPHQLDKLISFCLANKVTRVQITSKTITRVQEVAGVRLSFIPASLYCYTLGRHIISERSFEDVAEPVAIAAALLGAPGEPRS